MFSVVGPRGGGGFDLNRCQSKWTQFNNEVNFMSSVSLTQV